MRWAVLLSLLLAGCSPAQPPIVCDGNSLTYGRGTAESYPSQLQELTGRPVANLGVGAQTTRNMLVDAEQQVDSLYRPGGILVAWEVTNDLYFGADWPEARERFSDYCKARRAKGWTVIALTVLPRQQDGLRADFEQQRTAANDWLREHRAEFCDALIDLDELPKLSDPQDKRHFADGVHLTAAGYLIVAQQLEAAIRRWLDQHPNPPATQATPSGAT